MLSTGNMLVVFWTSLISKTPTTVYFAQDWGFCYTSPKHISLTASIEDWVLVAEKWILVEGFKCNSEQRWRMRGAKGLAAYMKSSGLGKQVPFFLSPVILPTWRYSASKTITTVWLYVCVCMFIHTHRHCPHNCAWKHFIIFSLLSSKY